MKTLIFRLLSALFLLGLPLSGQTNVADVVKRSSDAVVLITISNSSGEETALGSGFLVSSDGQIVTNYHVIKGAHSAMVKLSNGAFFPVVGVVASDPDKDLAIIKVNGKNLPFLTLGEIAKLHVGDHVVAIGSPLGLEGTASDGVVSAFRQDGENTWIQTTAPVSHGNSGGPLLDMNEHVIGVITWGVDLKVGQNLNFAAPSSAVGALMIAAQQPKSLTSTSSAIGIGLSRETIWTSLTSGRDYALRVDGDYLYIDTLLSPELRNAGAFIRDELKKTKDGKWLGVGRAYLPCTFTAGFGAYARNITNWCKREDEIEITSISDSRIEGVGLTWEKYDCRKCEAKSVSKKPFTWIPKK